MDPKFVNGAHTTNDPDENPHDPPMQLSEHLVELRKRLLITGAWIFGVFMAATTIEVEMDQPFSITSQSSKSKNKIQKLNPNTIKTIDQLNINDITIEYSNAAKSYPHPFYIWNKNSYQVYKKIINILKNQFFKVLII